MTMEQVYLCYEENSHELAIECGPVNGIRAFADKQKAVAWVMERVKEGVAYEFLVDEEYGEVSEERIEAELGGSGSVNFTMFKDYQENWNVSYDIIVQATDIER